MKVEKALIQRCINGERKAQFELYKECYALMMKICMRYQNNADDAKPMVNEAFLKVCDKIDSYQTNVPFEYWLRRITINTVIDNYRKDRKKKEHFNTEDTSESYWESKMTETNLAEKEMNAEALRALIRTLPPISQQVFNLCVLDGYDYAEISEMLSISESTCRWHVHFSRKKLQELIQKKFKPTTQTVLP